ncbi:MAG: radical SAM protein, partial [Cyclobacteriaceae bacterium]|nr:radical SAM protein [Cyclobacteriaceae bacterium]
MSVISDYLKDPFLNQLYQSIRNAGPIKSVSLDITHKCNLRCTGCYYFQEGMDVRVRPGDDRDLLNWVLNEKKRGTNFVTIVGGEPSLEIDRLRLLYRHFKLNVATNGLVRIPEEGLEDMPIGVAIWGNTKSDSQLRANGKRDLFSRALKNYKNDSRAFWYYTVAPGLAHEVYEVVERCIENGNRILFNYYSDLARKGTGYDFADGANALHEVIEDVMEKYPNKVLSMPYLHEVIMTGSLKGQQWGYDVCTNLSTDFKGNSHRL